MTSSTFDHGADEQTCFAEETAANRKLLIASREFATEYRVLSWWHLGTTLSILFLLAWVASLAEWTVARALGSVLLGLALVRMFVIYHDYQHQAIFRSSKLAGAILSLFGHLLLTPPSVWRRSHNHHHRHNSKLFSTNIGSFPIMTAANYRAARWLDRMAYRIARNPLVIAFGYFSVFLFGMCIRPLLIDPKRHWDAIMALLIHFGFCGCCVWFVDISTTIFVFVVPILVASSTGAYFFYVQHNFPGAKIRTSRQWSYTDAALQASSFLKMGHVMRWLTGNIGYHHVHHLNSKIPFYQLPKAMAALLPLQTPTTISLGIRDILSCLTLKLWDESQDRFVTFSDQIE